MSKNVAVFVDVANIFYAAKAAGVDIDYVTLLKSATAGRDFVRAYAYTGLDPENENQRQFHSFLARSGYKVVSKDIRKYGDGRIKANLDIELVVDMMRMAEHLDIAVVVSGDGDFAPAIRAVQQMGVRVEVISFRGNTSSDLMEVADVFIDIGQIARVEKGERSGRRVAAEGDLSMTEVPDKEAGVTPRRRRSRSAGEEVPVRPGRAAVVSDQPAVAVAPGLVALPGERLSRAGERPAPVVDVAASASATEQPETGDESDAAAGDRRRRRRGGRGRGRGGRGSEQQPIASPAELDGDRADPAVEADVADATQFADEVPTLPQHSTFGSVWDSQIGMPAATGPSVRTPATPAPGLEDVEGLDDEPEVPEYMLAERRQQGRRTGGRGRTGRQAGGYRSAIDRERYGPAGAPGGLQGGGRSLSGPRPSGPPRRGPEQAPAQRPSPGQRPAASAQRPAASAQRPSPASAEPWSEVPPEVQELLRAEVARRQTVPAPTAPATRDPGDSGPGTAGSSGEPASEAAEPRSKRPARRRSTAATAQAGPDATADAAAVRAPEPESAKAPPKRATRRRASPAADAEPTKAPVEGEAPSEAAPKRTTRRRATSSPEADGAAAGSDEASEAKPKRATRRRTTASADSAAD